MSLKTVGAGLAVILENISKLRVYAPAELPDSLNEFPCALILHVGTTPNVAMGSGGATQEHRFRVKLAVTRQDLPSAMSSLLDYLDDTGDSSVRAKVNADPTLNSSCDTAWVESNTGQGGFFWGGQMYLGTEFEIVAIE